MAYPVDFFSLLKDPELCPLFEEWLREDFSYENYAFWRDVEEYKIVPDEDLFERGSALYEKYFTLGSDWEVNADHYQKLELKEKIKNPTREVFDDIQISIFVLMRMDSYPKFMESPAYARYERKKQGLSEDEDNTSEIAMEERPTEPDGQRKNRKKKKRAGAFACCGRRGSVSEDDDDEAADL